MHTQNQSWCQLLASLGAGWIVAWVLLSLWSQLHVVAGGLKHVDAGNAPLSFHSPTVTAIKEN